MPSMMNDDTLDQFLAAVGPVSLGGAETLDLSSILDLNFGAAGPLPVPSLFAPNANTKATQQQQQAPASFANAFNVGAIRAQDDALLDSPMGLSPASFQSSNVSPFEVDWSSPLIGGFGTPETPDFGYNGADLPSLFATTGIAPQTLDDFFAVPQAPTMAAQPSPAGAVSPVMLLADSPAPEPVAAAKPALTRKASSTTMAASEAGEAVHVKDKFTGTRNTKIKAIDFDAPTLPKSYLLPSATSRKRAPAAITAKMPAAKKVKAANGGSLLVPTEYGDDGRELTDLPDELLSAIELKRRQNTLAARRSRMRKAGHLAELQETIQNLEGEVDEWKKKCEELEAVVRALRGC